MYSFYHLYVCKSKACKAAKNPQPNSQHHRGAHLSSATPREDVLCPGCKKPMDIARAPREGEIVEGHVLKQGDPIIYAVNHPPYEDEVIDRENNRGDGDGGAEAEVSGSHDTGDNDPNAAVDDIVEEIAKETESKQGEN